MRIHVVRAVLVLVNLLVIAAVVLLLWRLWQTEIRAAETEAAATVTQLQQSASATLGEVEVAVRYAAAQAEAQLGGQGMDSAGFWAVMDAARMGLPALQRMGIFDEAGQRRCSPQDSACRRYGIADRDYFIALRERPERRPFVHGPIVARPGNELALLVVQAIGAPDKPFAGAIVAVVPVSRLQALVEAARRGPRDLASLRTASFQLLARASELPGAAAPGAEPAVSDMLRASVAAAPEAGSYRAAVGPGQLDRIVAYRKLPQLPLYALIGLAVEDATSAWRSAAQAAAGLILLLLVASVVIERLARTGIRRHERIHVLYDEAPCGYHTLDDQGRYLSINATELNWLGCARDEVVGKLGPVDFFTEEGRVAFRASYPVFLATGYLEQQQFDLVSRKGDIRRVAVTSKAMRDGSGRFLMSNSVVHDITALHTAQSKLAALADEQQAMLDNGLVGMVKVRAGCITWTNQEMDRIFGYPPGGMVGMPIAQIFDDEALYQQTAARIGALEYRVGAFREEQELRRKDASRVWLDVSTVKIDPSGKESFTVVKDITGRKKAEAQRLIAAELEQQNFALHEAGRLKDEFLANMSHELRTPLNAVIGFAQLAGRNKAVAEDLKLARHVRQIGESGQHLLELIQTMLEFARSTSSKLRFQPSSLRVVDTLGEVAGMLEAKQVAAGVEVVLAVEPSLDRVVNDPLRLRQMLLNLLGNAIKFSRPGGVVRLEARALDDDRWCVVVADQGIGIAAENLPRLFAPFVQLSAGTTKAYGGTGLGLALVRSIARAQGGDVQVQSDLGKGSVFTLTLPRHLDGAPVAGVGELD